MTIARAIVVAIMSRQCMTSVTSGSHCVLSLHQFRTASCRQVTQEVTGKRLTDIVSEVLIQSSRVKSIFVFDAFERFETVQSWPSAFAKPLEIFLVSRVLLGMTITGKFDSVTMWPFTRTKMWREITTTRRLHNCRLPLETCATRRSERHKNPIKCVCLQIKSKGVRSTNGRDLYCDTKCHLDT